MKEKTLFKIALIGMLIGLPLLFFFSENIEITQKDISQITLSDIDKNVKVSGRVSNIRNLGNISVIKVTELQTIDIFVFDNNLSVQEGDYIDVFGQVDEYNGKVEIIADIIRRMKG